MWFDFSSAKATRVQPPVRDKPRDRQDLPSAAPRHFPFPHWGSVWEDTQLHATCSVPLLHPAWMPGSVSLFTTFYRTSFRVVRGFAPHPKCPPPFFFARNTLLPKDRLGFCRRTAVTKTKRSRSNAIRLFFFYLFFFITGCLFAIGEL